MEVKITARFFNAIREAIGKEVRINLKNGRTAGDFLNLLYRKYGGELKEAKIKKNLIHKTHIIQVNGRHIGLLKGLKTELSDGDTIDIIPIIEGG
jgi:MoaD family protein